MTEKNGIEFCDSNVVHEDVVSRVKGRILSEQTLNNLGNLFKIIGDPTRVKILHSISEYELCVCDICALLNMTPSAISHQLKVLKNARIVKNKRVGKNVYYSLDDEHIKQIFNMGLIHIKEE